MNYITDYQLDIDKGFMCKVNGIAYQFDFKYSTQKHKYYISNILNLADYLEIDRSELKGIFNSDTAYNVIYCNLKQQCYDLCQIIVQLYFRPKQTEHERLVPDVNFIYNDKLYQFTLKILNEKYVWQNVNDICTHILIKTHPDLPKIRKELNINISTSNQSEYLGFDTKVDAVKFIEYVTKHYYSKTDKQKVCEKSTRYLTKYYSPTKDIVLFPDKTFYLYKWNNEGHWFWRNTSIGASALYEQFKLTLNQVLDICKSLNLLAYFHSNILIFESTTDAIKFTDYLIETYIIKKEKIYDTNQLRKKRASLSRGAKPAGSIIHGRRSKASVRCGRIEHKACLGS